MRTAFVTGATRGLGLAVVKKLSEKGFKVYMGCRSIEKAEKALFEAGNPKNVIPIIIDVENEESIKNAYKEYLNKKDDDETLDVFFNNAGARLDWIPDGESIRTLDIDMDLLCKIYKINVFSYILTTRNFLPSMKNGTRIVNVVSGSGEFWDGNAFTDFQVGYATSKSAAIMMTKKIAAAVQNKGIAVNCACPGWCKTAMGGKGAIREVEQGADSIIAAAFLNTEWEFVPTGQYFRDGLRVYTDIHPTVMCETCNYKKKESAPKKPTFLQQIFSIRNENQHKVVRILGLKIKTKSNKS